MSPTDIEAAHLDGVAIVHLNSHHLYSDETRPAFEKLVELAAASRAVLSLDVSAANRLEHYGVARYRNELERFQPNILMANSHEAEMLGVSSSYPHGAGMVLIHRGSQPTVCLDSEGVSATVAVDPVDNVVDTTGAGDAFAAGFLSSRLKGHDLTTSIRAAHKLAAQTIVRVGAEFDVEHTMRSIRQTG